MDNKSSAALFFTGEIYAQMLEASVEAIKDYRKESIDRNKLAELYGIYYHTFAGLIRCGSFMYRKDMEQDGYATIIMNVKGKDFSCKDSAIRDIFKEDYDSIVHPYEDKSLSWVKPYALNGLEISMMRKEVEKDAQKKNNKSLFGNEGKSKKPIGNNTIQSIDIPVGFNDKDGKNANTVSGDFDNGKLAEIYTELESISGYIKSRLVGIVACALIMAVALYLL